MRIQVCVVVALLSCFVRAHDEQSTLRRLRNNKHVFPIESIDNQTPTSSEFLDLVEDEIMWRELLEQTSMSFSMSMSMMSTSCQCSTDCLPADASPFETETSVDIGSTGVKGETTRCGPNCYFVKGSGLDVCATDDGATTSEAPDAMHFSYTKVSGPFVLVSKVCGSSTRDSFEDIAPRTGLMVRESRDPLARNFFLSHSPDAEANWSARHETNGTTSCNYDGSPDVPCMYLVLERFAPGDGDSEFIGYYSYDLNTLQRVETCSQRETIFEVAFTGFSFPEEVHVGMAVLYGRENALYESQFNEIYFAEENFFRDMPYTTQIPI